MSYRTIAHHASSVRLTTSEVPVAGKGIFQTIYPEVLAFRQGTSPPSAKGTDFTQRGYYDWPIRSCRSRRTRH